MVRSLVCWAIIALALSYRSATAEPRLALLIGNQEYNDKVGKLINPHNDVRLLARTLRQLSFSVTLIEDADFATMQKGIRSYVANVRNSGPGTISFFYYSGHGAADADTNLNYLIPTDVADAETSSLWTSSIELKADVIDKLGDQANEAFHFVVFDACRNELKLKNRFMKAIEVDGKGFVPVQRQHFLIAYSTEAKRTASDSGSGSGAYARVLSEELVVAGAEAATVFRTVQLRMMQSVGQNPYSSIDSMPAIYLGGRGSASEERASTITAPQAELIAFERERVSGKRSLQGLMQQIGDAGIQIGGAFYPHKKWSKRVIGFCFLDGTREQRSYVASIARQWTLYGEIDFDFGPWGDPRNCNKEQKSDVAITFKGGGNWAFIGTDGVTVPADEPGMSLDTIGSASVEDINAGRFNREILHEFGHVLGFDHNWRAPAAGISCDDEFDWNEIYKKFNQMGWDKRTIDFNLRKAPSGPSAIGNFDKNSVMSYELPPSFFLKGRDSPCFFAPLNELSLRDKLAIFAAYK